jgi:hypothetical protein
MTEYGDDHLQVLRVPGPGAVIRNHALIPFHDPHFVY